ncbi:MAG: adenosylcobalamin-dependent ribonucleoside-diphosphate reductase [Candidatus Aenigmarchaeota archaeon]|nr:adenosylcobalamin-dependent ribonucleoside-diphosphate reductase [Candidatus Aenigmarchaeota archaeon]
MESVDEKKTKIEKIKKRDDIVVAFDKGKIINAIFKAAQSVGGKDRNLAENLAEQVVETLEKETPKNTLPTVEGIQDMVERILISNGHAKTAKVYILYRQKRSEVRATQREILNGRTTKIPFSPNALRVVAGRYLARDEDGNIAESPEEMFRRVARTLAEVEKDYNKSDEEIEKIRKQFLDVMLNFEFTPAGRTLANAGAPTPLISNCIVLHMEDSMDGIFTTLKDASLLQQAGAGLGFPFHLLRPAQSIAKRSRGQASGPVSFLRVYNNAFGVIKQQGRHGANMAVMRVDHPDIMDFINCKAVEGDIKNFNISVGLTDEFMEKVKSDDTNPWMCSFGKEKMLPRYVSRDEHGNITDIKEANMTPRELFDKVVTAAWNNGEPGVIFMDTVNKSNPLPGLGRIEACNPCGEQMLHDGDVCNLGSISLKAFAKDGKIDTERLKEVTRIAVRMLDNVIDRSEFPVEKVNKVFRGNRRIGLGIMGFADMLHKLGIKYDSQEGLEAADKVMRIVNEEAHKMSQELAKEKSPFPNWDKSIYKEKGIKMRNAALTTIAPTGTISMMFDCSSGLEPTFALVFAKAEVMGGQTLYYVNNDFEDALKKRGLYSEELMRTVAKACGSVQKLDLPQDLKGIFATALDISAEAHIRMQASFQKHVDNSITKTINFPSTATKEDVSNGYLLAWELGCKGCTVYRDKSRKIQVMKTGDSIPEENGDIKPQVIPSTETTVSQEPKPPASQEPNPSASQEPNPSASQESITKADMKRWEECPECTSKNLDFGEGCATCKECGLSACFL